MDVFHLILQEAAVKHLQTPPDPNSCKTTVLVLSMCNGGTTGGVSSPAGSASPPSEWRVRSSPPPPYSLRSGLGWSSAPSPWRTPTDPERPPRPSSPPPEPRSGRMLPPTAKAAATLTKQQLRQPCWIGEVLLLHGFHVGSCVLEQSEPMEDEGRGVFSLLGPASSPLFVWCH